MVLHLPLSNRFLHRAPPTVELATSLDLLSGKKYTKTEREAETDKRETGGLRERDRQTE